jgi:hypothetical protein
MEMDRNTGSYFSGTGTGAGTSANLAQAYIQFGGLTAGRTTSFFANGDLPNENITTLRFYDYPDVNVLAYTFSFGNGFSATLSLEDGQSTIVSNDPLFGQGGQRWPDAVANVKYAGTWGSVQVSGALHQARSAFADFDSELGWAIGTQIGFNLPALGAGDALWLAAAYADGALGYLGFTGATFGVSDASAPTVDAYIGADGGIETSSGWQVAGGLRHYWTPTLRSSVHGSYASVEYDDAPVGLADFTEWRVGVNTFWTPVSGLNIGVEALYANLDVDGIVAGVDDDRWEARLRIQRDF